MVQETHLTEEDAALIQELYGRRIHIINSPDPTSPLTARGVAFVLNRELVDTSELKVTEVVKGRAIMMKMKWHAGSAITLLNVYAPNQPAENGAFWTRLELDITRGRLAKPDVIAGDFNLVEEAVDRLPMKSSPDAPLLALKSLTRSTNMNDGWRLTNPAAKEYSFPQRGGPARSRIDRVYVTDDLFARSLVWNISTTGVPTDHCLITARVTAAQAPYIGRGRWTMPTHLLSDQVFIKLVATLGEAKLRDAVACSKRETRSPANNPQLVLKRFKDEARALARRRLKTKIPKLRAEISKLTEARNCIQKGRNFATDRQAQAEASAMQEQIMELERKRHARAQLSTTTHYNLNAENVSKYWSAINKERKPRDLFFSLRKPGSGAYEFRSDRMAALARDYHENLQRLGIDGSELPETRSKNISAALEHAEAQLSVEGANALGADVTRAEVEEALKRAGTHRATGLDGIPYEFWTSLKQKWDRSTERTSPRFDCVDLLLLAFQHLERYGPCEEAAFAEGWMCPLYKKKDRRDIENYRPITLLNSDYKTYTKILAMRLSNVVHEIVHPDQAGFIPRRQISDQTQLCRVMVDYAEATEEDGVIVALDQEKAYDKISHDYLWAALEKFGLPPSFIKKIKGLYEFATTVVILNGEISSPYHVERGARQGDPLSCLVFDIAIEPLACALRKSSLKGFRLPRAARKLVASLFADDTSTFLAASDKWSEVWLVIGRWCEGS